MIQRIQTIYLLLASAAMAVMFFFPLATIAGADGDLSLTAFVLRYSSPGEAAQMPPVMKTTGLGLLLLLCCLLPFINIFLFKRRRLQIKLCYAGAVLLLLAQAATAYYLFFYPAVTALAASGALATGAVDIMPLVALVFTLLAARAIRKDEALVRSLDRIR